MLGNNYASAVSNRLDKNESQIEHLFSSEKPSGKHWVDDYENIVLQKDSDENTFYLRTYYNLANNKPKTTYYVNGEQASDEQLAEIKNWVKDSSYSAKQNDAGLEKERQIVVRDYKIESVRKIKFGEFVIEE